MNTSHNPFCRLTFCVHSANILTGYEPGSSIAPTSLALRKKRYTTLSTSILHTQPPGVKQPRRRSTEVTRPQHTQNTQFRDAGLCQTIVSVSQAGHNYSYGSYNRGDRSW